MKFRSRLSAALLSLTILLFAAGCSSRVSDSVADVSEKITTTSFENPEASASDVSLPDGAETMGYVFNVLMAEAQAGKNYDPNDSEYFWTAVSDLAGSFGPKCEDAGIGDNGSVTLPSARVKEFAATLFASYDGNKKDLPKIPDACWFVSYNADTDMYTFSPADLGKGTGFVVSCTPGSNSNYYVTVQLLDTENNNTVLGEYNAVMAVTTYTRITTPVFAYSVSSFLISSSAPASESTTA